MAQVSNWKWTLAVLAGAVALVCPAPGLARDVRSGHPGYDVVNNCWPDWTFEFQEGTAGYAGTEDIELDQGVPNTGNPSATEINVESR